MKNMAYERKVDIRSELLQRIFDAARRVNDVQFFVRLHFT